MMAKLPKPTKAEMQEQAYIAYLLHENTCCDRAECSYAEDYTTTPASDNPYHCMSAVNAENAAAAIWRIAALRSR
jgi:hypothetical protein